MAEITSGFEPAAYLDRVGLAAPAPVSEDGLERLHRAQVRSIPFENFDIHLGRKLDLSAAGLVQKMVRRRRGGYCFELNGLLLAALRHFGFDARPVLARVHLGPAPSARTHQVSFVTLGGREWLADVGFGADSMHAPIPLELGRVAEQDGRVFRLVERAPFGTMLQVEKEDGWRDLYSFDGGHVVAADIAAGNHYTETHADSAFTSLRTAALPTDEGRIALRNFRFTRVSGGTEHVTEIAPGPVYLAVLEDHFGIHLDATYDDLKPITDEPLVRSEQAIERSRESNR